MGDNFSGLRRLDRVFRVSYEERLQPGVPIGLGLGLGLVI